MSYSVQLSPNFKREAKKLIKKYKGRVYDNWSVKKLEKKFHNSFQDFSIQPYKTSHLFTFKHYSYLITWHNKKIYINGDTGDLEPLSTIDNIEWVFAPFWIYSNARDEKMKIDTKMFGIYHLRPTQIIGEGFPDNVHFMTKQNEVITILY